MAGISDQPRNYQDNAWADKLTPQHCNRQHLFLIRCIEGRKFHDDTRHWSDMSFKWTMNSVPPLQSHPVVPVIRLVRDITQYLERERRVRELQRSGFKKLQRIKWNLYYYIKVTMFIHFFVRKAYSYSSQCRKLKIGISNSYKIAHVAITITAH